MIIPVVIGLGTGRCGTQTLSKLLNDCAFRHCTHEKDPQLPWVFSEEAYQQRKQEFLKGSSHHDVALHYLPYIERFIEDIDNIKIIGLIRDREGVVGSFIKKTAHDKNWRTSIMRAWVQFFGGSIDKLSKEQALRVYYDEYNKELKRLQKKYPDKIKIFKTSDLNTKQQEIFNWAEIPEKDHRYKDNPRFNTIEDHYEYQRKYGI